MSSDSRPSSLKGKSSFASKLPAFKLKKSPSPTDPNPDPAAKTVPPVQPLGDRANQPAPAMGGKPDAMSAAGGSRHGNEAGVGRGLQRPSLNRLKTLSKTSQLVAQYETRLSSLQEPEGGGGGNSKKPVAEAPDGGGKQKGGKKSGKRFGFGFGLRRSATTTGVKGSLLGKEGVATTTTNGIPGSFSESQLSSSGASSVAGGGGSGLPGNASAMQTSLSSDSLPAPTPPPAADRDPAGPATAQGGRPQPRGPAHPVADCPSRAPVENGTPQPEANQTFTLDQDGDAAATPAADGTFSLADPNQSTSSQSRSAGQGSWLAGPLDLSDLSAGGGAGAAEKLDLEKSAAAAAPVTSTPYASKKLNQTVVVAAQRASGSSPDSPGPGRRDGDGNWLERESCCLDSLGSEDLMLDYQQEETPAPARPASPAASPVTGRGQEPPKESEDQDSSGLDRSSLLRRRIRNLSSPQPEERAPLASPVHSGLDTTRAASYLRGRSHTGPSPLLHQYPPRLGDDGDEAVSVDIHTYRHLCHDLTAMKTSLLKLKRSLQNNEEVSLSSDVHPRSLSVSDSTIYSDVKDAMHQKGQQPDSVALADSTATVTSTPAAIQQQQQQDRESMSRELARLRQTVDQRDKTIADLSKQLENMKDKLEKVKFDLVDNSTQTHTNSNSSESKAVQTIPASAASGVAGSSEVPESQEKVYRSELSAPLAVQPAPRNPPVQKNALGIPKKHKSTAPKYAPPTAAAATASHSSGPPASGIARPGGSARPTRTQPPAPSARPGDQTETALVPATPASALASPPGPSLHRPTEGAGPSSSSSSSSSSSRFGLKYFTTPAAKASHHKEKKEQESKREPKPRERAYGRGGGGGGGGKKWSFFGSRPSLGRREQVANGPASEGERPELVLAGANRAVPTPATPDSESQPKREAARAESPKMAESGQKGRKDTENSRKVHQQAENGEKSGKVPPANHLAEKELDRAGKGSRVSGGAVAAVEEGGGVEEPQNGHGLPGIADTSTSTSTSTSSAATSYASAVKSTKSGSFLPRPKSTGVKKSMLPKTSHSRLPRGGYSSK